MINSISSGYSSMTMMEPRQMQKAPPPPDKDVFKAADTDGDGVVSETELEALLEGINEVTGTNISVNDAVSSYDADQDGALNGEELLGLLTDSGLPHPGIPMGEPGESTMFQPMEASTEQAIASYSQNNSQNGIEQLLELLQNDDNESSEEYSSMDITS